jgi:hypothetical protein
VIATDQRINGHQYTLRYYAAGRVVPACICGDWTGTPWQPTAADHWDLIHQAAAEWHKHTATAAPITREETAS